MSGKFLLIALLTGFLLLGNTTVAAGYEFFTAALQSTPPAKLPEEGAEKVKENTPAKTSATPKRKDNVESDAQLADRINVELKNRYGELPLRAEVRGGIVTLTGEVTNDRKRNEILTFVKNLKGVNAKNVFGNFTVSAQQGGTNAQNNALGSGNGNAGSTAGNANTANQGGSQGNDDPQAGTWWDTISTILFWLIVIGGVLLVIGLFAYAIRNFLHRARAVIDANFKDVKNRQDGLATKLDSSVDELKKDFDKRITGLQDEVATLRASVNNNHQKVLEGINAYGGASSPAFAGYQAQAAQKENAFPVSAEEFLSKRRSGAVSVKPDFQSDILIQDPEENGELMLVQDFSVPGGLSYVVPKVGYFQTKADFHNYYEKYYKCYRPASGEVWIIEPAVVDKVSGGWELRQKGELEIK